MGRRQSDRDNRSSSQGIPVDERAVADIIVQGDPEELVKWAEQIGKNLAEVGLTTSQIRNVFTTARKLQATWPHPRSADTHRHDAVRRQLVLLKPKLAYQAKRKQEVEALSGWLVAGIDAVVSGRPEPKDEYARFMRFIEFFEAILAYHTAFGGKQEEKRR